MRGHWLHAREVNWTREWACAWEWVSSPVHGNEDVHTYSTYTSRYERLLATCKGGQVNTRMSLQSHIWEWGCAYLWGPWCARGHFDCWAVCWVAPPPRHTAADTVGVAASRCHGTCNGNKQCYDKRERERERVTVCVCVYRVYYLLIEH